MQLWHCSVSYDRPAAMLALTNLLPQAGSNGTAAGAMPAIERDYLSRTSAWEGNN